LHIKLIFEAITPHYWYLEYDDFIGAYPDKEEGEGVSNSYKPELKATKEQITTSFMMRPTPSSSSFRFLSRKLFNAYLQILDPITDDLHVVCQVFLIILDVSQYIV